jgi:lysozyme
MKTIEDLLAYIKSVETFTPVAKQLPGDRPGVYTYGYGDTNCKPGECITELEAEAQLRAKLSQIEQGVKGLVKVAISQGQLLALVDFCYNCGVSALKGSTLLRLLNEGDRKGADAEFVRWNKVGGKVLAGLTHRRELEAGWFES